MKPNLMNYNGYTAKIELDAEDATFYGTVLDIRDTITFSGESFAELEESFRSAVDDYLAYCADTGREPSRPFSGKLQLRLAPHLHRKSVIEAASRNESLNDFFVFCISRTLETLQDDRAFHKEKPLQALVVDMTGLPEQTAHKSFRMRPDNREPTSAIEDFGCTIPAGTPMRPTQDLDTSYA